MSYRNWMKKWQVVIFWAIAASFVVGIGWWSAAFYIRNRRARNIENTNPNYLAEYSVAYLVKNASGTKISTSTFLPGMSEVLVLQDVDRNVGTIEPTKMWIEQDDFQKLYPSVKMYYESVYLKRTVDPVFEDYLLRAETIAYMGFTRMLQDYQSIEPVPSSTPSTNDVYEYFDKNASELAPMFSEYHIKAVTLDSTQLVEFQKDLLSFGFDEAASAVGQEPFDLGSMKGEQLLSMGIDKKVVKEMYEVGKNSVVGPQPFGRGWLFVEVLDSTPVKNASDLTSDEINKIRSRIVSERIRAYVKKVKDYYQKRGEAIVINDDNLRLWYDYYRYLPKNELVNLVKLGDKIKGYVVKSDGEINVDSLSTMQALYVLILEREKLFLQDMEDLLESNATSTDLELYKKAFGDLKKEDIKKKIAEIDDLRKKIVSNLYYSGYKVYGVLQRMVEIFGEPKYRLELAEISMEGKKEIAQRLKLMYGMNVQKMANNFMPELQTFFSLMNASDTSISTDLKLRAMEDSYDLLKFLGAYQVASSVLNEIKQASPSYKGWNFQNMFSELEKLMKPATSATNETSASTPTLSPSTPATNSSSNTTPLSTQATE